MDQYWNYQYGGFIYNSYLSDVTECFWDTETSGTTTSNGGIGKTTAEMKVKSTFTDAGWSFPYIWDVDSLVNDGYPYLNWVNYPLSIPTVNLNPNGIYMNVYWSSVPDASCYNIYTSFNPIASFPDEWELAAIGVTGTIWTDRKTRENKKFYKVVAVSEEKKSSNTHKTKKIN